MRIVMIRAQNKIMKDKKIFQLSALRHTISSFIIVMPLIGNPGYGMEGPNISTNDEFSNSVKQALGTDFYKGTGIIGTYYFDARHGVIDHATLTEITGSTLSLHLSVPVVIKSDKEFIDETTPKTAKHNYHIYYHCTVQKINETPPFFLIKTCNKSDTNIASHAESDKAIEGTTYHGSADGFALAALGEFIEAQNTRATQQTEEAQKKAKEHEVNASAMHAKKTESMKEGGFTESKKSKEKSIHDIKVKNSVLEESIKTKLKKAPRGISINKILNKEELAYYNRYMKK